MSLFVAAAVIVVAFCGGILQANIGFGVGLLVIGILPHVMGSVVEAAAISNICGVACAAVVMLKSWRSTKLKDLLLLLPLYFVFMPIGNKLILNMGNNWAKIALGVALILYSLYTLLIKEIRFKASVASALTCGGLSGLLSGMFALSSPPVATISQRIDTMIVFVLCDIFMPRNAVFTSFSGYFCFTAHSPMTAQCHDFRL